MLPSSLIVVAKIGKTHGVRGALKAYPLTEDPELLSVFTQWFLRFPHKSFEPLTGFSMDPQGDHYLIRFDHIHSPEDAQRYVNAEIAVPREQLPKLDQGYYWSELLGLTVINTEGVTFGVIDHLMETGANDVMVLKGEQERLVPYLKHVVQSVDLEKKQMIVDWGADW